MTRRNLPTASELDLLTACLRALCVTAIEPRSYPIGWSDTHSGRDTLVTGTLARVHAVNAGSIELVLPSLVMGLLAVEVGEYVWLEMYERE